MKIAPHLLREGFPKTIHEEYDPKKLDLEFVDLFYLDTLVLNGTVEKLQNTVTFRGRLTSRVEHVCARCLKRVEGPVDQSFELIYDVKGKEELDTLDDLREVLLVDHPIRFLCREDCRGLCPRCGVDLNEETCSCET